MSTALSDASDGPVHTASGAELSSSTNTCAASTREGETTDVGARQFDAVRGKVSPSPSRPQDQNNQQLHEQELVGSPTQPDCEFDNTVDGKEAQSSPTTLNSNDERSDDQGGCKRKAEEDGDLDSPGTKSKRTPQGTLRRTPASKHHPPTASSSSRKKKGAVPLRERPVHELTVNDFKINASRNGGVDHPYVSVVRNKEERKRLAGCTNEKCCGPIFRLMALTLSYTEEEARQAFKDYLGDEEYIVDDLDEDERQKLLLEARTWCLAKRYGRHKENRTRPPSPPGFWRTEMPDTQQVMRDHEEADKQVMDIIRERRRDAMRADGLWRFADEPER